MKKTKFKLLNILLTLALAITIMPAFVQTVHADSVTFDFSTDTPSGNVYTKDGVTVSCTEILTNNTVHLNGTKDGKTITVTAPEAKKIQEVSITLSSDSTSDKIWIRRDGNNNWNSESGNVVTFSSLNQSSTLIYCYSNSDHYYVTAVAVTVADETYTVTLNTNGGTINSGNITSYTYGTGATLPTDVTKDGSVFGGWCDNINLTGTPVTAISATDTGNKEFWAKWNAVEYYPLWVGNRQVTSAYLSNETEGWSYDPKANVLALNNANITDTNTAYSVTSSCISINKDLTISLSGNNTVGSIDSSSLAINSNDVVLTITGSGSLTVNSKEDCIEVAGKLIINNTSVTINGYMKVGSGGFYINGSEVKVTSASGSISALGLLSIKDSRLEATGDGLAVLADDISTSGNSEIKATATSQAHRALAAICALDSFEINRLEIVTPEGGKIIKGDADLGQEVFTVFDKDGNVAKEVLIKSVTPEYTVVSGAGGTYVLDSGKDYTLTVKRNVNDGSCFDRFTGVELDGQELTKETDYTAVKGSTVITLKASTLNSLSEGDHKITVNFDDGKAETSLTVKKASAPTPEPEPELKPVTPYRIPKTGIE